MRIAPTHLRRIEDLETRTAGPAPTLDGLSFGELADLPGLAPAARERLLKLGRSRTVAQVEKLRRHDLDQVEAAIPARCPVTLEAFADFLSGAATPRERRIRGLVVNAARTHDLSYAKMLHGLATTPGGAQDH